MKKIYLDSIRKVERNCFKLFAKKFFDWEKSKTSWNTIQPDGSWSDLDYIEQNRCRWQAAQHLVRILEMCAAWAVKDSAGFHDRSLGNAIKIALKYWFTIEPRCENWWFNDIFVPRTLGPIYILGKKLFSADEIQLLQQELAKAECKFTGQNRIWCAETVLFSGIIEKNITKIAKAHREIVAELKFSCDEGIRHDGCFHQHSRQIQLGTYGLSFIDSLAEAIFYFAGSTWQLSPAKLAPLRHLAVNGTKWSLYKGVMDLQAQGRCIFQNTQSEKYQAAMDALQKLADADRNYRKHYFAQVYGNRMFYNSDMMIHRTGNCYFSCRANSVFTKPVETVINYDNLLGQYFSDGCTQIMRSGKEYYNIAGCWEWTRLPGTTTPATPRYTAKESEANGYKTYLGYLPVTHTSSIRKTGESKFTGGVSTGEIGAMIYSMDLDKVQAKKAVFCFGDLIVALGSGIDSTSPYPVATTVEQSLLQGKISSGENWYFHNGIGYYGKDMQLFAGKRRGDWKPLSGGIKVPTPDEKEIFQLTIEHGTGQKNGSYCYAIIASGSMEDTATAGEKFTVLANDRKIQAVRFADGTVMAVFHERGELDTAPAGKFPAQLAADKPGIFIISGDKIYAADPSRKRRIFNLTWRGKALKIELPEAPHRGKTTVKKLPVSKIS